MPCTALLPSGRWTRPAALWGSLPAALAQEPWPLAAAGAAFAVVAGACLRLDLPAGLTAAAVAVLSAWCLLAAGGASVFAQSRRLSRRAGLQVLVAVPEVPALLRWRLGRLGLIVPGCPHALSVHVDPLWRPPDGITAVDAARLFAAQYRGDYDRLLEALAGLGVLVLSSTFNRHDSERTRQAVAAGWCHRVSGPLFSNAPRRHGPAARRREQRRMFGATVTLRRVERPEAWRTRVFDCGSAPSGGRRQPPWPQGGPGRGEASTRSRRPDAGRGGTPSGFRGPEPEGLPGGDQPTGGMER